MDLSLLGANQIDGGNSSAVQDQLRNVQRGSRHISGGHLLLSWQMDLSLLGEIQIVAAIALPCKISSGMCSRFTPQV